MSGPGSKPSEQAARDKARKQQEQQRRKKQLSDTLKAIAAKDLSQKTKKTGETAIDRRRQTDTRELGKEKRGLGLTLDAIGARKKKEQTGLKSYKADVFRPEPFPQSKLGDARASPARPDRPRVGLDQPKIHPTQADVFRPGVDARPPQSRPADAGGTAPTDTTPIKSDQQQRHEKQDVPTEDLQPTDDVLSLLKASKASLRGFKLWSDMSPALEAELGEKAKSLKNWSALASGAVAGWKARERGVSTPAQIVDGAAAAALSRFGGFSPIDNAVRFGHAVVSGISPEAGKYTKAVAEAMPSKTAEGIATGAIDAADAAIRGDADQLARQHDHNLKGDYGVAIQGYSIAAEAAGAVAMAVSSERTRKRMETAILKGDSLAVAQAATDAPAFNRFVDAASSGELGMWAKAGDWLGGKIFDLIHGR